MKTKEKTDKRIGKRVRCISMKDNWAVPPNTCGTIVHIDDMGVLHIKWDNGSTLGLIHGVDDFEVID